MGIAMQTPFRLTPAGGVATAGSQAQQLNDAVHALVATVPGERVARATYGVATPAALFAANGEQAHAQVSMAVRDAVAIWESAAQVTGVTAQVNEALGLVLVQVEIARSDVPGAEGQQTRYVQVGVDGSVSGGVV